VGTLVWWSWSGELCINFPSGRKLPLMFQLHFEMSLQRRFQCLLCTLSCPVLPLFAVVGNVEDVVRITRRHLVDSVNPLIREKPVVTCHSAFSKYVFFCWHCYISAVENVSAQFCAIAFGMISELRENFVLGKERSAQRSNISTLGQVASHF